VLESRSRMWNFRGSTMTGPLRQLTRRFIVKGLMRWGVAILTLAAGVGSVWYAKM
jgi:hypothetical protein